MISHKGSISSLDLLDNGDCGILSVSATDVKSGTIFNAGDLVARDSSGDYIKLDLHTTTHSSVGLSMVDGSSHITPHNPWSDVLSVILGNSEPITMSMPKSEWLALDSRLSDSMRDIGYENTVELAKAGSGHTTNVKFYNSETERVALIIKIIDDEYVAPEDHSEFFDEALKDL